MLEWIDWTNGNGYLRMGIGSDGDRGQGLGTQALGLLLRFAFAELNLFRVTVVIPEYCEAGSSASLKKSVVARPSCAMVRNTICWS